MFNRVLKEKVGRLENDFVRAKNLYWELHSDFLMLLKALGMEYKTTPEAKEIVKVKANKRK